MISVARHVEYVGRLPVGLGLIWLSLMLDLKLSLISLRRVDTWIARPNYRTAAQPPAEGGAEVSSASNLKAHCFSILFSVSFFLSVSIQFALFFSKKFVSQTLKMASTTETPKIKLYW